MTVLKGSFESGSLLYQDTKNIPRACKKFHIVTLVAPKVAKWFLFPNSLAMLLDNYYRSLIDHFIKKAEMIFVTETASVVLIRCFI